MKKSFKPIMILLTDTHLNKDNIELNRSIFNQAADLAIKLNMKRIFHAGDIFDNRVNQTQRTLIAFKAILTDLWEKGIELHAIPGNHDKVDYESRDSYLSVYTEYPNFVLYENGGVFEDDRNDVSIYMLPYFKEATVYPEELNNIALEASQDKDSSKKILITHIAANGVKNNDGTTVDYGIPPNAFKTFDKVFVGHYHNAQEVGSNVVYIGSTFPHNFGENNNKGIVVVNDDLSYEYADTDFPRYHKHIYKVGSDQGTIEKQLGRHDDQDHVRVEVVGSQEEVSAFDQSIFKDQGVDVKKKSTAIETNISSVETSTFSAHTSSSIIAEFDVFCGDQGYSKAEIEIGKKYIDCLRDVEA